MLLQDKGWDVELIVPEDKRNILEFQNHKFNIISLDYSIIGPLFDITVATLFITLYTVL